MNKHIYQFQNPTHLNFKCSSASFFFSFFFFPSLFLWYVSFLLWRYKRRGLRGKIRGVGENKCCMEFEIMYLVCVFPSCLNQAHGGRVALGLLLVTVSVFLDFSPPPFQRQSWIEKRGGTGCGLLAEGELNSHSLSFYLSLSCTLFFFQWRLKSIHSVDCWHSPAQRAQDLWLPLMGMLWTKALPSAQFCQPPVRPTPSLHPAFKDAGTPLLFLPLLPPHPPFLLITPLVVAEGPRRHTGGGGGGGGGGKDLGVGQILYRGCIYHNTTR